MAEATTNFSRSGTVGPYMNVYLPFFNASMQGTARFAKQAESLVKHLTGKEMTAEEKREGANAMWYTAIGVLAATAYAFNPFEDDDEDYLEARATDRDRFWLVGWNGTTHARIPKPRDTAFLFNLIETIGLNVRRKQAADSGNSFGDLALRDLLARIPTGGGIVRSGVEVFANYDTFRGREIESQYMTSGRNPVPKFLRTDAYTSVTADKLGLAASKIPILKNLSPKQIEFLLQGYSGGGYKRLATMLEGLLGVGKRDLTLRDFPGSSAFVVNRYQAGSIGDLYDQAEDVGMQLAIALHNAPSVTDKASYAEYESYYNENISGLAQKKARLEEAAELMKTIREMEDKTEGGQRTFELEPYINGVAREALGRDRLESAMNIFEAKELPPKLEEAIKEHVLRKAKVAVALYGMPTKVAESDSLYEQTLDKYEAKVAAHRDWINRNKDSEVIKRAVAEAYSSSKMRSMFSMPRVKTKEEADNFRVRFERQRDLIKSLKEDIGN